MYLVHRLPYPPNKGDKIRSYNLLKLLSRHFDIYLGSFVNDFKDWSYLEKVQEYCKETFIQPLEEKRAKLYSLTGLLSGKALSLPYYKDKKMQDWVDNIVHQKNIRKILIYSSTMAQYVEHDRFSDCIRIADFVDIDSDKWLQYSQNKSTPMKWIYSREASRLAQYERRIGGLFQKTLFATRDEMQHFSDLYPEMSDKIDYYNNGVDTCYFDPSLPFGNPYHDKDIPIVFTGAMDYWPNVDAVKWFAKNSFRIIREAFPQACFYIVGSNPAQEVQQLARQEGVFVTGSVEDIRPYIRFARIIVAPVRIARGVQNKVLEGMAMSRPIVMTPMALAGIEFSDDYTPTVASDPGEFAQCCLQILNSKNHEGFDSMARNSVLQNYNWDTNMRKVLQYLDKQPSIK